MVARRRSRIRGLPDTQSVSHPTGWVGAGLPVPRGGGGGARGVARGPPRGDRSVTHRGVGRWEPAPQYRRMTTTHRVSVLRCLLPVLAAAASCLPAALLWADPVPGAPAPALTLARGSRLWLEGDSTLHAYSSRATRLDVQADLAAPLPANGEQARAAVTAGALKGLRVSVPVAGLKSGESGLDKNLDKALRQDAAPYIRFILLDYRTAEAKDGALVVTARGRLAVAGVERETTVEGTCRFDAGGIEVSGTKDVLMSDYGVKPPVLMFGAIKTADKVVVHFELKLQAAGAAPANHD